MKIIGLTGGKGGTGKSTVATALAVELGKNVCQRIPDFDLDKCTGCGLCGKVCATNAVASVKELINHKKNDYDYIIIDTSAGIRCDVLKGHPNRR